MSRVRPILFNNDMVRAILDGRKTVARRCVKARSKNACGFYVTFRKSDNAFMGVYDYDENERQFDSSQTPPYQPGDILYVREAWEEWTCGYLYRAWPDGICQPGAWKDMPWRPSIHMPREAARIWLKVTDVRVERLQEITPEQIIKEGTTGFDAEHLEVLGEHYDIPFATLWDSTIKKSDLDLYGWAANPWVWVIEFEPCGKPDGWPE
ncbi:hypothetical protein IMSAG025_02188 [Muribaculaceae bacterium]|nr:hypothetical protein IMSAG025_02188 [Muribaculaceae bacterium]